MVSLIIFILIGMAAGYVAGNVMNTQLSLIGMAVLGILGSVVGGVLFGLIGFGVGGPIARFIVAAVGAALLIYLAKRYNVSLPF